MSLGERNNNPLNIRKVPGTHWRGEVEALPQRGSGEGAAGAFVQFRSILWGLRAAFCILNTYREKYNLVCVEDIISRWAPPSENDTKAYIEAVCKRTRFGGKERLTEKQWPALVAAMAVQESGMKIPAELIESAFSLYQTLKPKKK